MASAFEFVQGNERLDWGVLVSIDVHRLMKDTNVDTLQRVVENIAFSRITRDEAAMFTPDHILQLFQLSQLVIQYLVYSQECLAKMNLKLNERLEDLQGAQRDGQDSQHALMEENAALKKEVKAQRRTLLAYEYNAAAGARPATANDSAGSCVCPLCGEVYHKQESLQSHMRKRHYGVATAAPGYAGLPQPAPPPPPLAPSPSAAAAYPVAGAADELQRVQARVQQLESKLERDREATDRQRDQMMLLLLAKNSSQGPASMAYTTTPPPPPQSPQSPPQTPALPAGTVPVPLPGLGTPAFDPPHRSGVVGASLLPGAIASIPVVPDTAALMAYNESRQREAANNTLTRQLQDLEKEIRDLRSGKPEVSGDVPAVPGVPGVAGVEASVPAVSTAPSWLSSLGLPSVPTSTPIPLPNATGALTDPLTAPMVSGVAGQVPGAVPPPPPPPPPPAPVPVVPGLASGLSEAQRQQELANYLKYGPTGPAFVPPPPPSAPPIGSIVPLPNTPLPPPPPSVPSPQLATPKKRRHGSSRRRHGRLSSSSSSSSSYSYSSSDSRTASPVARPVPVPLIAVPALPQLSPPLGAYEVRNTLLSTPKHKKDKKDKKDKREKKSSRHAAKGTEGAVAPPVPVPVPGLETPHGVPSASPSQATPAAPLSYAAMLQQYQDQLLRPSAAASPLSVPALGASTPLQLNTVGSPPLSVSHTAPSPAPLAVPGVGYNYGIAAALPAATSSTSATLPPAPALATPPRANVPAWLRTQESRASSSGSSSSTSTVPPNRASGAGPTTAPAPPTPALSITSVNTIPVPTVGNYRYGGQEASPLGVPSAGATPVPLPVPGSVPLPSTTPTNAYAVPSTYATAAYMTGATSTTATSVPTAIPVPVTTTAMAPIPIPSPYYSTAAPIPGLSLPQHGSSGVTEVKSFHPRMSSSQSSSSGYSY